MENQVSIIIPVYNSENYLRECVDSVLNQTYENIEVILIDDGSMDQSFSIIQQYVDKFPEKVRGYTQKNSGVAKTRNRGIELSQGEFLMFADNDDYMEPEYVERMVGEIKERNLDMLVSGCRKVDSEHRVLYEYVLSEDEWSKFRVIAPWSRIMRRDFVIRENVRFGDFKVGEDSYFTVTAYNSSPRVGTTKYIGYQWIHRESSVSNTIQKKGFASPIPFLESLITRNSEMKYISGEYFEYFIIKFVVWNLIYVCNSVDLKTLDELNKKYFEWLENKCPKYKRNGLVKIMRPKSEQLYVRILVWIFAKAGTRRRLFLLRLIRLIK